MIPANFRGRAAPLGPSDIGGEARALQCTAAIIHAFSDLESGGASGFLSDGRPKILAEARSFHLFTHGEYDAADPNISSPVWDRSLYGAGGAHQWDRFLRMYALDPTAALQSCSIGKFQVMGSNFRMVGFASPEDMWAAFCDSERAHLDAFAAFIRAAGLQPALQADPPEFVRLAVGYNGPGERANGYDQKLEVTFDHYAAMGERVVPSALAPDARTENPTAAPLPPAGTGRSLLMIGMVGPDVAALQRALGLIPGMVDGRFGAKTEAAVEAFQLGQSLVADGKAGPQTLRALHLA